MSANGARAREAVEAAIRRGGAEAAFQPIMSLDDGLVVGVEVLARLSVDGYGIVAPDTLVPVAAAAEIVTPLLHTMVSRTRRVIPHMSDAAYVAFNVHPQQFDEPGFAEDLLRRLERGGLRAERVVLEVTERESHDLILRTGTKELAELRSAGVRIAVDDMGTGYSNLRALVELGPDIVKVDRSLVAGLPNSPWEQVVGTLVALAREIRASVVAEGIETHEQLESVSCLGVDAGQGYLLGAPVTEPGQMKLTWPGDLLSRPTYRPARVGIVEDDERLLDLVSDVLTDDGHEVPVRETSARSFISAIRRNPIDIAVVDLVLRDYEDGMLSVVQPLRAFRPEIDVVVFSSLFDPRLRSAAEQLGCTWLEKASGPHVLSATIETVAQGRKLGARSE